MFCNLKIESKFSPQRPPFFGPRPKEGRTLPFQGNCKPLHLLLESEQDIMVLLREHHKDRRTLDFYADKMNMPIKTLSKKVKAKMKTSLGQLIRIELINTAKLMLLDDENITEVSYRLGFKEPNHFTSFFKHYTKILPSDFISKKYNA